MRVTDKYFRWLCGQVCDLHHPYNKYSGLLETLHEMPFTYTIEMDRNRDFDGRKLRYDFADDFRVPSLEMTHIFGDQPSSVLEMMIALSVRCEDTIMYDEDLGNQTGVWFWHMIENLGLMNQTNRHLNRGIIHRTIRKFLNREYNYDGSGGGFVRLKHPREDLRNVEIWYQFMWYLVELVDERR